MKNLLKKSTFCFLSAWLALAAFLSLAWLGQPATAAPTLPPSFFERTDLVISGTKIATSTVEAGQELTYTLVFSSDIKETITITDHLPAAVHYKPGSATGTITHAFTTLDSDQTLRWVITDTEIATDTNITLTFVVTVTSPFTDGETITNTAWLSGSELISRSQVTTVTGKPDLELGKTAMPPSGSAVQPEDRLTYTLWITNSGNGIATDLIMTDTVPMYTQIQTTTAGYTTTDRTVRWDVGSLGSTGPISAQIIVAVLTPTTRLDIVNSFTVSYNSITSNLVTHTIAISDKMYLPMIIKPLDPLPTFDNGDFEEGPGPTPGDGNGWQEISSFAHLIVQTEELPGGLQPYSGDYVAWLGGKINEISTLSQTLKIPQGYMTVTLRYHYLISSVDTQCGIGPGFDFAQVTVGGKAVAIHQLCANGNTNDQWVENVIPVSVSTGNVTFIFNSQLNNELNSNFFLDDISLEADVSSASSAASSAILGAADAEGTQEREP